MVAFGARPWVGYVLPNRAPSAGAGHKTKALHPDTLAYFRASEHIKKTRVVVVGVLESIYRPIAPPGRSHIGRICVNEFRAIEGVAGQKVDRIDHKELLLDALHARNGVARS